MTPEIYFHNGFLLVKILFLLKSQKDGLATGIRWKSVEFVPLTFGRVPFLRDNHF
jgi:hypothetical protein